MGVETVLLASLAAGSALSAVGSIQQGNAANAQARAQAAQLDLQAAQERDTAVAQAEKIRRAGRSQTAAADAAFAASGVSVGEGTPVRINEAITRDAEDDAYSTILTGSRRGSTLDVESALTTQAGKNARTSGYMGAAGSLLQGASQYGQWKALSGKKAAA